jgi:hypothetical protein
VKRKKQRAGACPILHKVSTDAAAPKSILEQADEDHDFKNILIPCFVCFAFSLENCG